MNCWPWSPPDDKIEEKLSIAQSFLVGEWQNNLYSLIGLYLTMCYASTSADLELLYIEPEFSIQFRG